MNEPDGDEREHGRVDQQAKAGKDRCLDEGAAPAGSGEPADDEWEQRPSR